MEITDKQIERFTQHVLDLEAQRLAYKEQGKDEYVRSGIQMIDSMLYTAKFFGLPVPIVYQDGTYQLIEEFLPSHVPIEGENLSQISPEK